MGKLLSPEARLHVFRGLWTRSMCQNQRRWLEVHERKGFDPDPREFRESEPLP